MLALIRVNEALKSRSHFETVRMQRGILQNQLFGSLDLADHGKSTDTFDGCFGP